MGSLLRTVQLVGVLAVLLAPSMACAAADKVGVIFTADSGMYRETFAAFEETLEQEGFGPARVAFLPQHPNPDYYSWANSARRLEGAGAKVIVALGAPAARVAMKETTRTPVVFAAVQSPWDIPLVSIPALSSRDRSQASGASAVVPLATLVKAYSEIGETSTLTAVFLENDPEAEYQMAQLHQAAALYGLVTHQLILPRNTFQEALSVFADVSGTLYLPVGIFSQEQLDAVYLKAEDLGLPIIACGSGSGHQGALVSLEASPREQGEHAAKRLMRLLEGGGGDMPPEHATRNVELVINLDVARRLGVKVPFQALTAATRIIR